MSENADKINTINIITHINELMSQTEVTQYFKNTKKNPIELEVVIPKLSNSNISRFEMIKNNKKVVSKLLEKEKAKEKYNDSISTGDVGFVSFNEKNENKICLGNIQPNEEIELKTFYFGHLINKNLSYQAFFPVIFPNFVMGELNSDDVPLNYNYEKEIVKGKIYIKTRSKITRLVINASKNFSKIEKKYSEDKKSVEIDIYKDNFSVKDIPGIILFRTEKINDDVLYCQCDQKKNKTYYMLQKTLTKPEFSKEFKDEIDEDENLNYYSLLKNKGEEENQKQKECYIFLLDQSGSMSGDRINLSCKSLLLFLQSLHENCFFQLIGFGSDFEFFSDKPMEYNKKNVKNLMDTIKNLGADRGGTELYAPLNKIFSDKIYNEYDMKKNIILLTDGELFDKERVINLIGANSNRFVFNSIGIGNCDKDLIERTALMGNGYSYYISNLKELNPIVISLLEKSLSGVIVNCSTNQKCSIEDDSKKLISKIDYFTHGFILDDVNIKNIEFKIKIKDKEIKISFDKDKIVKLPEGDNLGKLIVDTYLNSQKCKNSKTRINLSKEYNVLTNETAFYAKMTNEEPSTEKMIKMTNEGKEAANNKKEESQNQNIIKLDNEYIYNDETFGYDIEEVEEKPKEEKKGGIAGFFRNLFSSNKDADIIKQKNFIYKAPKQKKKSKKNFDYIEDRDVDGACPYDDCCYGAAPDYDVDCCYDADGDFDFGGSYKSSSKYDYGTSSSYKSPSVEKNEIVIKNEFAFDEFILNQDVIEGNWTKDSQCELLIEQEKDIYEKIKKYSENKGIKNENGIITLFVLYYIYNKKSDKLTELKFVINKAKDYVKRIFKLEYDDIIREIETK